MISGQDVSPATIEVMKKPKVLIGILVLIIAIGGVGYYIWDSRQQTAESAVTQTPVSQSDVASELPAQAATEFDKSQYSLTDPASIWVIVNKQNDIPISYTPDLTVPDVRLRLASSEQQMQIRPDVAQAVQRMFAAAKKDEVTLVFGSGYRSGALQQQFYSSYKAKDGQAAADRYSARPGHSEHQTGLAFDLTSPSVTCHLEICWEDTSEGKWVAKNAYQYGFVLRYQDGKEAITGYQYEPWHFRYVGIELASQINDSGQTLEEFFGLPAAPNYD